MIGDFPIQFSIYTNCPLHHVFLAWEACVLNCLEHEFWKNFWPKDDSSHFKNSPSFQLSQTWSDILRVDEKFIHQLSAMFTCGDGKGGELSSRASKMLYGGLYSVI